MKREKDDSGKVLVPCKDDAHKWPTRDTGVQRKVPEPIRDTIPPPPPKDDKK